MDEAEWLTKQYAEIISNCERLGTEEFPELWPQVREALAAKPLGFIFDLSQVQNKALVSVIVLETLRATKQE